jgi:hypothetical protein
MEEAFLAIERAGRKMGLVTNENKTKYMVAGKAYRPNMPPNLIIPNYTFARVNSFVYLGSTVSYNNDISEEIGARLVAANRAYFGLLGHFKSRLLSRQTKLNIYKTLVRPVLTYASETWAIAKTEERLLELFERKILRRILGPICENGEWRKRFNRELYDLYGDSSVIGIVKSARLRWAGHVARMDDNEPPRKVLLGNPGGQRRRGRPKLRWEDGVEEDVRKLGCRNWRMAARNRDEWRRIKEAVKVHFGL